MSCTFEMFFIFSRKGGNDGIFFDLGELYFLIEEVVSGEIVRCSHGNVEIVLKICGESVVSVVKFDVHIFIIKELYQNNYKSIFIGPITMMKSICLWDIR